MRYLGGHLGPTASALLDGQLDASSTERAWGHVHGCESCRRQVEREGWVKTRLSRMAPDEAPPAQLLGALYGLGSAPGPGTDDGAAAWAAVHEIERRGRGRRRTGLAVAGAGSVSLAVFGLASLTGSTLGIGGAPAGPATSATTRTPAPTTAVVAPLSRVHGRLPAGSLRRTPGQEGPASAGGAGAASQGLLP